MHTVDLSKCKVGDAVYDTKWGFGRITFINPNPKSKLPVKVHFTNAKLYSPYNYAGLQYACQQVSTLLTLPIRYTAICPHCGCEI